MSTTLSIDTASFRGPSTAIGLLSTAVSKEAGWVTRDTKKVGDALDRSQSLFGKKSEAISELYLVADECSEENWDGHGALPLEPWAVRTAERFIRVLPEDLPMPEVNPEPDGSVGIDWAVGPRRIFSVSFGANLRLAYAWLDGTDRGHAVARFDGESIPPRILAGIRQLTGIGLR